MVCSIGLFVPRDEKETKGHKLSANLCTRAFIHVDGAIHPSTTDMYGIDTTCEPRGRALIIDSAPSPTNQAGPQPPGSTNRPRGVRLIDTREEGQQVVGIILVGYPRLWTPQSLHCTHRKGKMEASEEALHHAQLHRWYETFRPWTIK